MAGVDDDDRDTTLGISMGTYQVAGCLMSHSHANLYYDGGHVELPAFVAFTETECLVGREAFDQMEHNPENTIYDIKRLLGRFYDDPDIQDYLQEWPFKVIEDKTRPKYQVTYKGEVTTFFPEEIMGLLFKAIREHAEHHLCKPVTECVLTVPSQFNSAQRQSAIDAALMTGLFVIQVINECTAAAIVYGYMRPQAFPHEGDKHICLVSAGSGFLDISLIIFDDGVYESKATRGISNLDVNRTLIHHFAGKILERHGVDVFRDKSAYVRLWKACEEAKRKLKRERRCVIKAELIAPKTDFEEELSRDDLDELLAGLKASMRTMLEQCLEYAGWNADSLCECPMVGGTAELPCLQDAFDSHKLATETRGLQVVDYPHLYALIGAGMRAAALKGGSMMGLEDLITMEVSPKTVGMKTNEGKCRSFVIHNDRIPRWTAQEFLTHEDFQEAFRVEVFDGDSNIASHNKLMGSYTITGFPLRKRGRTMIQVTFEIDPCGLLVLFAEDRSPGTAPKPATVQSEFGLIGKGDVPKVLKRFRETFPLKPVPKVPAAVDIVDEEQPGGGAQQGEGQEQQQQQQQQQTPEGEGGEGGDDQEGPHPPQQGHNPPGQKDVPDIMLYVCQEGGNGVAGAHVGGRAGVGRGCRRAFMRAPPPQ